MQWLDNGLRCSSCTLGITEISPSAVTVEEAAASAEPKADVTAPISVPPVLLSVPLPRCLGCGHRTSTVHEACVPEINPGAWVPCGWCQGLRLDGDGFECEECCGAGFIPMTGHSNLAERAGDVPPWRQGADTQA